jgi:hypothetical protein
MTRTVTVVFGGEVFRPTEPVDLPANSECLTTIDQTSDTTEAQSHPLAGLIEFAMDMGIPDLAEQHDHYLYGTPKR